MKKKRPSLLDIEVLAQKRADSKLEKLKNMEAETFGTADLEPAELPEEESASLYEEEAPTLYDEETPAPASPPGHHGDDFMDDLVEFVTTYRSEIVKLKNDLFKVKEQVRIFSSMMNSQQKKIAQLMKMSQQQQHHEGGHVNTIEDDNYYRLVLRSIIWLKEEKGFSTNDVIRLFRAEGFQTPAPHKAWNEKVVEQLYVEARRRVY